MSNHGIQIERSPSPVMELKPHGKHGNVDVDEPSLDFDADVEQEEQRRDRTVESSANPKAHVVAMPKIATETPRQRARRLEHQRLREFATSRDTVTDDKSSSPKPKMFKVFAGQEGNTNQQFMIPSPPGLDHEKSALLGSEEGSTSSNNSEHRVSAQLERVESLVREYVQHQNVPKHKELIRHVSVMRDNFEAQQNMVDKQPKVAPPIRQQSAFWKSSKAREKESILVLLREFEAVEDAVNKWSSAPESLPRECLREITIFRLSVLSTLEHHPILLDGILLDLTQLETTIIDYKTKPKRKEWCRSKEAVRRTAVLKARLRQPDWDEKSPKSAESSSGQPPQRGFSLYQFSSKIFQSSWMR